MSGPDGPDLAAAEHEIIEALYALGADSDAVTATLRRLGHDADGDTEALCTYLQERIDPQGVEVVIDECDTVAVYYRVINPDGLTYTHADAQVPTPVLIYFARAEQDAELA